MNQFKNPLDPDNLKAKDLLKKWLSAKLKLGDKAHIEITEYQCADSGCLHAETVFKVSESLNTPEGIFVTASRARQEGVQIYKIAKPLVFIRRLDIDTITQVTESKSVVHKH